MLESLSWLSLEKKEKDIEFVQIIPFTKQKRPPYQSTQPAWDVSERSQSDLHWEREISETSQKHLKRDVFFVTYLRRPKSISKKCLLCDMMSLRRLKHISEKGCLFHDVSEMLQKDLSQVFLVFQKYVTKMTWCDFRRVITISDKIDVGPSEKWNVLSEQWIDINQVCPVGWYQRESFGKSRIVKTQ